MQISNDEKVFLPSLSEILDLMRINQQNQIENTSNIL